MGLVKHKPKSSRKEDQSNHDVLLTSSWGDEEVRILHLFICSAFYCHVINKTMVNKLRACWCPPDTTMCPSGQKRDCFPQSLSVWTESKHWPTDRELVSGGNILPGYVVNEVKLKRFYCLKAWAPYQTMLTDFLSIYIGVCPPMLH